MEDGTISRKDLKRVWVAGFFEGEGTIGLYIFGRDSGKNPYINKRLTIENTNKEVIDYYVQFLKENDIKFYFWQAPRRKGRANSPIYAVTVCSYRHCEKLIKLLFPYLIGKKRQAQTMLDFFEYRKTVGWTNFPTEAYKYAKEIKQLKESPEAICQTPKVGEDMVHAV